MYMIVLLYSFLYGLTSVSTAGQKKEKDERMT